MCVEAVKWSRANTNSCLSFAFAFLCRCIYICPYCSVAHVHDGPVVGRDCAFIQ